MRIPLAIALAGLCLSAIARAQTSPAYVWIEGEAPAYTNMKPNIAGWGHKEFLSGEKWLHISIDADKVEKELPPEGGLLQYALIAPVDAHYQVWNRIGFEFVRSAFDWRIDDGAWQTVLPDQLTTDLMEMDFWTEVAWLKLGEAKLAAGSHRLEIRLRRATDEKGKPARVLYASDALCLTAGPFHPNSWHKPDDSAGTPADRAAAEKVFDLPAPVGPAARSSAALQGAWQVCRNDEQLPPADIAVPMQDFPEHPIWTAIEVPGDRNELRPDLLFAHRLWYRTRVRVPEACAGRSFHLVFPCNNLNTTVYVNGIYCGFEKSPYCRIQTEVTKAMKPGVNEVWVGIRDAWYGHSTNPRDPMKLRKLFNLPPKYFSDGFQDLAYPIWGTARSGILNTPELVCAGPVKSADVFVKTSVVGKRLDAEVTLLNGTGADVAGEVSADAVDEKSGRVVKSFPASPFRLPAGEQEVITVSGAWADPQLWWPDQPHMYVLRTTVKVGGKAVDTSDQSFGFREWGVQGDQFTLNGVVWPIWCDLVGSAANKEEWLKKYRATNERSMRLMGATQGGIRWMGMTTDDALDWFDREGVVVRRCGPLDGEAIGYFAVENDPDLKALYKSDIKMDLMQNWRDQMVAQVKGERNHPSVMLWSVENEWLYINCINLYGGLMDEFEKEVTKCSDAVRAVDPTRLTMTDGGGATKAQSMPVHGNHYVFGDQGYSRYPQLAYEPNVTGGGRGRWVWDRKRPRFIGEEYFASGINPADYAIFGGEAAFLGKTEARPAAGLAYQILQSGYRWSGQSAWNFWLGDDNVAGDYSRYNAPRAVLWKDWSWTFGSGEKVDREYRVYNDTHYPDPIAWAWTCAVGGRAVASGKGTLTIPPGESHSARLALTLPAVSTRQEGVLSISLRVNGQAVFTDSKPISVLPAVAVGPLFAGGAAGAPSRGARAAAAAASTPGDLLLYDPHGAVARFLRAHRVSFTALSSLAALPASRRTLLIGPDALSVQESTSSALAAWAAGGGRVVVLDQDNPLRYQALPAALEPSDASGSIAFAEDLAHPIFHGLKQQDFFIWAPDGMVYRSAYLKPSQGARSLVQCHDRLLNSALVEVPVGSGLMLLCQLELGEKLATNAVAQQLLANLLGYADRYRQTFRPTAVAADNPSLNRAIDAIGLKYTRVSDPLAALAQPGVRLAVIEATPANLHVLAANLPKVQAFERSGGYLLLNGLTPDGLEDYNQLVGFDHMIRPFWREKVQFPAHRHPLTAGLTSGDIVMLSGERIFPWTSDEFVVDDEFSYVVDLDNVAPFMHFPNDFAHLMVDGFRNADAWKYIVNLPQKDADWTLPLPKPQTLTEVTWTPNQNYHYVTKFALTFDGKATRTFDLQVNDEPQTFPISPPVPASEVRVRITEVQRNPTHGGDITGLDNLAIRAQRPADFAQRVRPLLNIGGMVEYPFIAGGGVSGPGGIVLCNLKFKPSETVAINAAKKQTILATLLRNLNAPFTGGAALIAGAGLHYEPVDLSRQANQYRDAKGWFGDRSFTFEDLPTGKQSLGGVKYQVYDFPTSPVPTVVMLGGSGVPNSLPDHVDGIPVNRKADALFFLHAARIDAPRSSQEVREKKRCELWRYVVHYADGQTASIPIYQDEDVADFRQKTPTPIPGAQIAWTKPYAGTEWSAVAYGKQWDNPRPEIPIARIDLVYGTHRRAVPALIAVTAATHR